MLTSPQLLLLTMAVLALAIYVPALLSPAEARKEFADFAKDKNLLRSLSIVSFLFAYLFLSVHYTLNGGWLILFAILGWVALLKALYILWSPESIRTIIKSYTANDGMMVFISMIGLLFGLFLGYAALYQF